jgi:hypothetical protein
MWLGCADPFKSQDEARAVDPERDALRARVLSLVKYHDELGGEFKAAKIAELALDSNFDGRRSHDKRPDLLEAFSCDGRNVSTKSVGLLLRRDLGRMVDGYHVELLKEDAKRANTWCLYHGKERLKAASNSRGATPDEQGM